MQEAERKGQRVKIAPCPIMVVLFLRNLTRSAILQLPLTFDWPDLSHVATFAAREAGTCSLFPGSMAAPKNTRVALKDDRKDGSQVGSWQALPRPTLELLPPNLVKMAFLI